MAPETVVTVDLNKQTQQQAPPPQQQQGGALDWIKINIDYFKSPPGILKVVQLVSNFKRYKLQTANFTHPRRLLSSR